MDILCAPFIRAWEVCMLIRLLIPPLAFELGGSEIASGRMHAAVACRPHRETVRFAERHQHHSCPRISQPPLLCSCASSARHTHFARQHRSLPCCSALLLGAVGQSRRERHIARLDRRGESLVCAGPALAPALARSASDRDCVPDASREYCVERHPSALPATPTLAGVEYT
jgi:hypothetical protein